jgi:hypothetical protein
VQFSSEDWPQVAQDSEQGALTTSVGSRDNDVHAWLDFDVHLLDQDVSVGGCDGNVLESDGLAQDIFSLHHIDVLDLLVRLADLLGVDEGSNVFI